MVNVSEDIAGTSGEEQKQLGIDSRFVLVEESSLPVPLEECCAPSRTNAEENNGYVEDAAGPSEPTFGKNDREEEGFDASRLPPRLFATDRYPAQGRINSYSKPDYLLDLTEVLHGSTEFEWLKASCFGRLFQLPVRKSSLSGKLVHQFLCRSLVTKKKHELWFIYGGHPIRFSLREFGLLTGLNCDQYPSNLTISRMQNPERGVDPYFHSLIGPKPSYTIQEIMKMLKDDKALDNDAEEKISSERRLKLALIVIVEGILVCKSSNVKATKRVAEMVKDVDEFCKYPWGRQSFKRTLEMVKVGKKVDNVGLLTDKLSQSHSATHGFTLSIQLLVLQVVPLLQRHLPDANDENTFTDRAIKNLTMLKTFHNSNILKTENDPELQVESLLFTEEIDDIQDYSWDDEVGDEL